MLAISFVDRLLRGACLCAGFTLLGACQDYLARRDTLTQGSGEAVHANAAMHVIDPWPPHAKTIETTTNGERLQHAMERYRNPGSSSNNIAALPPIPVGASNVPALPGAAGR